MPKPTSRKKKPPKRVLALPDLEHAKTAVLNSPTSGSGQRTYDMRFVIRRVVLLGAAPGVQPHRGAAIPYSPRAARLCAGDDQSEVGRRPTHSLRGSRRAASEPRTGGGDSPREGREANRRAPRKLAER
jgi:hypothetical protein